MEIGVTLWKAGPLQIALGSHPPAIWGQGPRDPPGTPVLGPDYWRGSLSRRREGARLHSQLPSPALLVSLGLTHTFTALTACRALCSTPHIPIHLILPTPRVITVGAVMIPILQRGTLRPRESRGTGGVRRRRGGSPTAERPLQDSAASHSGSSQHRRRSR